MKDRTIQKTADPIEDDLKIVTEKELLSGDRNTSGDRQDETEIVNDQDMTNAHDITPLDGHMGALSTDLEGIENDSEDFIQGDVDLVTQMDRATRAMDVVIDQSEGRKAHPRHNNYKTH